MPRENSLTAIAAWFARIPFRIWGRRSFSTPKKVLILKPCCLSQVMLTTPLLAVLSHAYPDAQFDWAISQWARPAVAGNPRISEFISMGGTGQLGRNETRALLERIRAQQYDTCIIPSRSGWLAYLAWRAGIPQRIGLDVDGRGFSHTIPVRPLPTEQHEAERYLALARALSIDPKLISRVARMEFYPPDAARTAIAARLVEEAEWLGDVPLVVLHPGGGWNPLVRQEEKQWPVERFVRLGNYLARQYKAQVVLVGAPADAPLAATVAGLISVPVLNLAGSLTLGELGALCELADLYVGNDTGSTHIAAAVGCPTLAIFGPSDPALSGPYMPHGRVRCVYRETAVATEWRPTPAPPSSYDWSQGASVEQVVAAADELMAFRVSREIRRVNGAKLI